MIAIPDTGLRFSQLVSYTTQLWRATFPRLWGLSILIAAVNILPFMLAHIYIENSYFFAPEFNPWFILLGQLMMSLVLSAIMYHQLLLFDTKEPPSLAASTKMALRKIPAMLFATLLCLIIVCAGFLLLILPGFFILVASAFFLPLMMLLNMKPIMSIVESFYLVIPHWWRTAFIILVPTIVLETIWFYLKKLALHLQFLTPQATLLGNIGLGLLILAAFFVVTPWLFCLFSVYLCDLLNRNKIDKAAKTASNS